MLLDEIDRKRIHEIPPKLGIAVLYFWTAASLSRGPNFLDWFRFYFWGQRPGEQKRVILPTQIHVKIT